MARGLAIPQRVASVPLSTCRSRDDEPIDAERQPQLFPQPFEVRTTRANESSLQVFPVVVIATTHVGTSLLVDDRAISVEQAARLVNRCSSGIARGPIVRLFRSCIPMP